MYRVNQAFFLNAVAVWTHPKARNIRERGYPLCQVSLRGALALDFSRFDDLRVVSNDLTGASGFTLTCIVRDEMYFLPPFLDHYRGLGVKRFIFLDDNSRDGTREYLFSQPDCMVLASNHNFGDIVPDGPRLSPNGGSVRFCIIWTNLLVRKFSLGRWSLHVDADEFLQLPEGMRIGDFLPIAEASGANAVWSVLLDLYPADISALRGARTNEVLDPDTEWYFDARRHLQVSAAGEVKGAYSGSRARLMDSFGIRKPDYTLLDRLLLKPLTHRLRGKSRPYNCIFKAPLLKMPDNGAMRNQHRPTFPGAPGIVLPLEHFKFTPQIYDRVAAALRMKQYYEDSIEYKDMERLLIAMEQAQGDFRCSWSSSDRSWQNYVRTGVAQLDGFA